MQIIIKQNIRLNTSCENIIILIILLERQVKQNNLYPLFKLFAICLFYYLLRGEMEVFLSSDNLIYF